jgi:TATA-box binding protein (TBP) (component of TFIID and TFIIIB)
MDMDIDTDWDKFCCNTYVNEILSQKVSAVPTSRCSNIGDDISDTELETEMDADIDEGSDGIIYDSDTGEIPKCSDIYISTKTKIAYLSQKINLRETFWKIKISPYHTAGECIIKKQMKFNSMCEEELDEIKENLKSESYWDENIITRIVNPEGRIKYKDIRKISVGLSKKDILSYRLKRKSAFYNCFVVVIRLRYGKVFKEIHVKVFNTGKLEIPGIQTDDLLEKVLNILVNTLQPIIGLGLDVGSGIALEPLSFNSDNNETVLINSNFNCGFYIKRDKLYDILKYKYHINSGYDPCSYPGIQCKFYYNTKSAVQNGQQPADIESTSHFTKISFMIFRTGSVLIVGKCNETILNDVYLYIKDLLANERTNIQGVEPIKPLIEPGEKKRKLRKKIIFRD